MQAELIDKAQEIGLLLPQEHCATQLKWLSWFRELRNVTRGHGVVQEKGVAPLWDGLHRLVLDLIAAMELLTLSSVLVATEPNGNRICLRGWYRARSRNRLLFTEAGEDCMVTSLSAPGGQLVVTHPLIVAHTGRVFVWERIRRDERMIEFLDYGSWKRMQVAFSDVGGGDPYAIWKSYRQLRG